MKVVHMKKCVNGHTVHPEAYHDGDGTCYFCGDFVWLPTTQDLREMKRGDWLFYPHEKANNLSGRSSHLKKEGMTFTMKEGKLFKN